MKTAQASGDRFQNAGEPCESCRPFWEHQGLPPMTMVHLLDADGEIVTTGTRGQLARLNDENDEDQVEFVDDPEDHADQYVPVVVCPRCDGDMIFRLPKE